MNAELQPTEQPELTAPDPNAEASRDELIAAVKEAGGTESVRDAVATEAEAAGDPAPPPAEEEPRIAAILKAREKAAAEREAARNEAEELRARAREEAEELRRQAREEARREAEAERERLRAEFRSDPVATARALAGDTDKFVDELLRAGTPEARALAQLRQELETTKKVLPDVEAARKEIADLRAQAENEKRAALIAKATTDYMATATPEKAPYLNARYDEQEILQKADKVSLEWQRKGLVLHKDFDFNDVTQHLEMEAKKKLSSLASPPAQQVSAGAPAKEPGLAPKVSANGSRTLSAASGSERRTSPKPFSEMTRQEQRDALIEEAAAARRANPGAKY